MLIRILFILYLVMFSLCFQGGVHRLESVEEYNELMVRHGDPGQDVRSLRDGGKHSLPQLLDSTGTSQVVQHCRAPDFLIQSQLLG